MNHARESIPGRRNSGGVYRGARLPGSSICLLIPLSSFRTFTPSTVYRAHKLQYTLAYQANNQQSINTYDVRLRCRSHRRCCYRSFGILALCFAKHGLSSRIRDAGHHRCPRQPSRCFDLANFHGTSITPILICLPFLIIFSYRLFSSQPSVTFFGTISLFFNLACFSLRCCLSFAKLLLVR